MDIARNTSKHKEVCEDTSKRRPVINLRINTQSNEQDHRKQSEGKKNEPLHDKLFRLAEELENELQYSRTESIKAENYSDSIKALHKDSSTSPCSWKSEIQDEVLDVELDTQISTPRRESHCETFGFRNQSFFLKAALELLESKMKLETQILEEFQQSYPDAPAKNEVIRSGHLRKGKDGQFAHWKARFVVVSAGMLTYASRPDKTSGYGESHLSKLFLAKTPKNKNKLKFDGNSKAKRAKSKSVTLIPGTRCKAVNRKTGKYMFEMYTPSRRGSNNVGNVRLWLANSEEDRIHWMQAIHIAASEELQLTSISKFKDSNCQKCESLWRSIYFAHTEEQYIANLTKGFHIGWILDENKLNDVEPNPDQVPTIETERDKESVIHKESGDTVSVPVEWIQTKMQRRRGVEPDNDMNQVFRDMTRDRVSINGEILDGTQEGVSCSSNGSGAGPGVCDIICTLARAVIALGDSSSLPITEAKALAFSREVLLACNRTQSGGNIYEAVNLLCGNPEQVAIIPESVNASPLNIDIYNDSIIVKRPDSIRDSYKCHPRSRPISASLQGLSKHRRESKSDADVLQPHLYEENISINGSEFGAQSSSSNEDNGEDDSHRRHRRTFSEPAQLDLNMADIRLCSNKLKENATEEYDDFGLNGPRADVQVKMKYKICKLNFEDEHQATLANVIASFNRSFVMAGQKAIALGQGLVKVSITSKHG